MAARGRSRATSEMFTQKAGAGAAEETEPTRQRPTSADRFALAQYAEFAPELLRVDEPPGCRVLRKIDGVIVADIKKRPHASRSPQHLTLVTELAIDALDQRRLRYVRFHGAVFLGQTSAL